MRGRAEIEARNSPSKSSRSRSNVGEAINPDGVINQIEAARIQRRAGCCKSGAFLYGSQHSAIAGPNTQSCAFSEGSAVDVDVIQRPDADPVVAL